MYIIHMRVSFVFVYKPRVKDLAVLAIWANDG